MFFEIAHRRIHGTSAPRRLARTERAWRDRLPFQPDAVRFPVVALGPRRMAARFRPGFRQASGRICAAPQWAAPAPVIRFVRRSWATIYNMGPGLRTKRLEANTELILACPGSAPAVCTNHLLSAAGLDGLDGLSRLFDHIRVRIARRLAHCWQRQSCTGSEPSQ